MTPRFSDGAAESLKVLDLDWEDETHRLSGTRGKPRIPLRLEVWEKN